MTSHPRDFDSELAHTIANLDKVCRHFHLPLQSGCNRILGMMNRGYTTEEYLDKINLIRSLCPDAVITTDIIVGFPDETENDFNQTLSFLETCEFDAAYTFLYSPKTGTPAAEMKDQIPEDIKKNRLQRLMDLQNPISLKKNQAYIGKILPVMVEGISKNDPNTMSGRTDGNKIVIFPNKEGLVPGDIVDVHITEAKTWNLLGHLVN